MWMRPAARVAAVAGLAVVEAGDCCCGAAPVLALWLLSPGVAWWLSRPLVPREPRLGPSAGSLPAHAGAPDVAFFETFVGPEDNYLPPDNFQEDPPPSVAHRTSPTNIGLALLANLAAYDFGYITAGD